MLYWMLLTGVYGKPQEEDHQHGEWRLRPFDPYQEAFEAQNGGRTNKMETLIHTELMMGKEKQNITAKHLTQFLTDNELK